MEVLHALVHAFFLDIVQAFDSEFLLLQGRLVEGAGRDSDVQLKGSVLLSVQVVHCFRDLRLLRRILHI